MKSGFHHRANDNGSFDSICLRCYRTVASNNVETALVVVERHHECDPLDIRRVEPVDGERPEPIRILGR